MTNIPPTGTETAPKRPAALIPLDLIRGFLIGSAELVPGVSGGTIALGNVARLAGQTDTLLVGGTGLLAAEIQFGSAVTHDDITPLAVTVEEYDVIVVPADSPYETLDDLVRFDA